MSDDGTAAIAVGPLNTRLLTGSGVSAEALVGGAKAQVDGLTLAGPRAYGVSPLAAQLARAKSSVARSRVNKSSGAWAFMGDSTFFGTGATARNRDLVSAMAAILNANGIPTETDSVWGMPAGFTYAAANPITAWDTRLTNSATSGLGAGGGVKSLGGSMYKLTASGDWIAFTPEKQVNRIDIWYPSEGQFGAFSVSIDGGVGQTVNQTQYGGVWSWNGTAFTQTTAPVATSGQFARAQFNLSALGAHTVRITWVSGTVHVAGIHGFRSDLAQLGLYNWGRPGETAVNWAAGVGSGSWNIRDTNGRGPLENLPIDLVFLDLGINDANTGVTDANYLTAMQQLITAVKTRGSHDLAMNIPVASNYAAITEAAQRGKWDVIEDLAVLNSVPILADMPVRWGYYAGGSPLGYYSDNTHPENSGYADKAIAMSAPIASA